MTAVIAILVDSYRELIAKKLFWFVLAISLLIVLSFGSIGFNEKGVSIGYGLHTFEFELLRKDSPYVKPFMDMLFASVIVKYWLAWGAIILALVSTAEVFPNFLAGGAIDLILPKPVRRSTVFFSKYLGSLLFVLMQVTIFCVGTLLVMRWRMGEWRWPILVAIPMLMLVFSYLYSVMVLLNTITRSTLPSLLITMSLWVGLFSLHATEQVLLFFQLSAETDRDAYVARIEAYENLLQRASEEGNNDKVNRYRIRLARDEQSLQDARERVGKWTPIHGAAELVMLVLPKTSATTNLVQRHLTNESGMTGPELQKALGGTQFEDSKPIEPPDEEDVGPSQSEREAQAVRRQQAIARRAEEYENNRPWWMIIGTSLIFEAGVLAIACFIFVRRDN